MVLPVRQLEDEVLHGVDRPPERRQAAPDRAHEVRVRPADALQPELLRQVQRASVLLIVRPAVELLDRLDAPSDVREPASRLRFRNTILVYLRIADESPFVDQWIYVHSPELRTGRITNFSNWVTSIRRGEKDSILCLEYWCYDDDPVWRADEADLVDQARREIYKTGLVSSGTVVDGVVRRVPKCYPVYSSGYRKHLAPVERYLSTVNGVTPIGRYGSFKYNNQDHSMMTAMLAVDNIVAGRDDDANLWDVNLEMVYQEE